MPNKSAIRANPHSLTLTNVDTGATSDPLDVDEYLLLQALAGNDLRLREGGVASILTGGIESTFSEERWRYSIRRNILRALDQTGAGVRLSRWGGYISIRKPAQRNLRTTVFVQGKPNDGHRSETLEQKVLVNLTPRQEHLAALLLRGRRRFVPIDELLRFGGEELDGLVEKIYEGRPHVCVAEKENALGVLVAGSRKPMTRGPQSALRRQMTDHLEQHDRATIESLHAAAELAHEARLRVPQEDRERHWWSIHAIDDFIRSRRPRPSELEGVFAGLRHRPLVLPHVLSRIDLAGRIIDHTVDMGVGAAAARHHLKTMQIAADVDRQIKTTAELVIDRVDEMNAYETGVWMTRSTLLFDRHVRKTLLDGAFVDGDDGQLASVSRIGSAFGREASRVHPDRTEPVDEDVTTRMFRSVETDPSAFLARNLEL